MCVIDVLISELESPTGYDPSEAFDDNCGGGVAGWLGATDITLQDVENTDTLVYSVVDPQCDCEFEQKLVINPVLISSVDNNEKQTIEIFPNPANDVIKINGLNANGFNYSIFDTKGQNIQLGKISKNQIDVSELHEGLFFLETFSQKSLDKFQAKFIVFR